MTRRRVIAALVVLGVVALGVVYLPLVLSGNYHRAAIERLASDALGRKVTIAGSIKLALIPDPQLRAKDVIIGGPHGGQITAKTLKLALAPGALLLGRLRATKLSLNSPDVVLPWPLPGGTAAVAPPPWLASLHAKITDGRFRIGALVFGHADLSVFTGGPQSVLAASGTALVAGVPVSVTLELDHTGSDRPAPVMVRIALTKMNAARVTFHGTIDRASLLAGHVDGVIPAAALADLAPEQPRPAGPARLSADLVADGDAVALRGIDVSVGAAGVTGDATIDLRPGMVARLDLAGHDLAPGPALALLRSAAVSMPLAGSLALTNVTLGGIDFARLRSDVTTGTGGIRVQSLNAALPDRGTVSFQGGIGAGGAVAGRFTLGDPDPATTLAALRAAWPGLPGWPAGFGALQAAGRISAPGDGQGPVSLDAVRGTVGDTAAGRSGFSGAFRFAARGKAGHVAARLDFGRLVLGAGARASLLAAFAQPDTALSGPIEITARRVVLPGDSKRGDGKVSAPLNGSNLLVDARLGGGVAVRLASVRFGEAQLVAHGIRADNGAVTAARIMLTGKDGAATLGAVVQAFTHDRTLPAWATAPVFRHRFAAAFVAAGPASALHSGLTLHLGAARFAAMPVIDLATDSAAGPLSLRAPSAIALITQLGGKEILGGPGGLDWPGAGSVSLRASAFATGTMAGLSDFVLSLGALTASGRVDLDVGQAPPLLAGGIAADTLVLPATPMMLKLADTALAGGIRVALPANSATRVEQAEVTLARDAGFGIAVDQGKLAPSLTLGIDHAGVLGGRLAGSVELTGAAAKSPPTLSVALHLAGADAARVAAVSAGEGFALPVTAGTLDLATNLTASGATPAAWRGDVSGSLSGSGTGLDVSGLDLAKAGQALGAAVAADRRIGRIAAATLLRAALGAGQTMFDKGNFSAAIGKGKMTIANAALTGNAGTLGGAGTVDFARNRLDLTATAKPNVDGRKTAPDLPIAVGGDPARPSARPELGPAMNWIGTHIPHAAAP